MNPFIKSLTKKFREFIFSLKNLLFLFLFSVLFLSFSVLVDALRATAATARRLEEATLNLLLGTLDVLVGAVGADTASVDAVEEAALFGLAVLVEVDLLLEHPLGATDPLLLGVRILIRRVVPGAELLLLDDRRQANRRRGAHDRRGLWDTQALALVAGALLGDPLLGPDKIAPTLVGTIEEGELLGKAGLDSLNRAHRLWRMKSPPSGHAVVDDRLGLDLDKGAEAVVARARRHFG